MNWCMPDLLWILSAQSEGGAIYIDTPLDMAVYISPDHQYNLNYSNKPKQMGEIKDFKKWNKTKKVAKTK